MGDVRNNQILVGKPQGIGSLGNGVVAKDCLDKIPSRLEVVAHLPRNTMGKVVKPAVKTLFED